MKEIDEKGVRASPISPPASHSSDTQTHIHQHIHTALNLEEIAREKGYEKIVSLGAWYLWHKRHEYEGEYAREHYYTYDLLWQDLKKLKKIELPDWTTLHSPWYGWANDDNVIVTHGVLSPLFKNYALFDYQGLPLIIRDKSGAPIKRPKLSIHPKSGEVILLIKSESHPTWVTDSIFHTVMTVEPDWLVWDTVRTISEYEFTYPDSYK